ncbi:MAG: TrkA family potassium uptake protein [Chloroflexi bacterium]|nr:TrkA family potassium uptake protein [Chloroflexota bacterium]
MKVIVMGCGRVGSQVSILLTDRGHDVTVIDHRDMDAATRLGPRFKGRIINGLGFDESVLISAGITAADAFIAASSSDNANIVGARIAKNIFKVPRVVARLFDPRRAEIYQRLGLKTISTTTMGAERIYESVTHSDLDMVQNFGHGEVSIVATEINYSLEGRTVRDLNVPGEFSVITITRNQKAFLPTAGTEFRAGDLIYLAVQSSALARLQTMLGL